MSSAGGSFKDWTRRLRVEDPSVPAGGEPHPLDVEATDSNVGFAAEHTRRYIATNGENDGWDGPRPVLILYTSGRRSGLLRRNPVLYFDFEDERYLVASKGGADANPDWYLNLLANPRVHVRVMADLYEAVASKVAARRRAEVWPRVTEKYPMFADYQTNTTREIPLVRLDPV